MGVDFIRKRAKTFRKSWDSGRVELTKRTLFTEEPDCVLRAAVARLVGSEQLEVGSRVLLRLDEETLFALKDLVPVAVFVNPPTTALEAIERTGGYANGEVVTFSRTDGLAEITVC